MKVKFELKHGTKHLFILSETGGDRKFVNDFFKSNDEISVQLTKYPSEKYARLIFGKSY